MSVERLSTGCERVIGRSHLQVSEVRREMMMTGGRYGDA